MELFHPALKTRVLHLTLAQNCQSKSPMNFGNTQETIFSVDRSLNLLTKKVYLSYEHVKCSYIIYNLRTSELRCIEV